MSITHVLGAHAFHLPAVLHAFLDAGAPLGFTAVLGVSLPQPPPYDDLLAWSLKSLIFLANVAGGMVVGVATLRGLAIYEMDLIRFDGGEVPKEGIRLSLGFAHLAAPKTRQPITVMEARLSASASASFVH